jgi:DNA-binding CsgD family transcriptional regulator
VSDGGRVRVTAVPQTGGNALPASSSRTLASSTASQPVRQAVECFGQAIIELLECNRCVLARARFPGEEIRLGCVGAKQAPVDAISQIVSRKAGQQAFVQSIGPDSAVARALIGREPAGRAYAVAGAVASNDGQELVFLAGWRPTALSPKETACLSRAVGVIWSTLNRAPRRQPETDLPTLLEELVCPAFIVDERLHIHESNSSGRRLLMSGDPLRSENGALAGLNASTTARLKEAFLQTRASWSERTWMNTFVALSTRYQHQHFAWVGMVPNQPDANQALILAPQVDAVAGARRIAAAFALSWAEERIVGRILQGQSPSCIGVALHLTEATVRTYTKRIMLKLGINRQLELFILYILTLSPLGAGQRERTLSCLQPWSRLYEGASLAHQVADNHGQADTPLHAEVSRMRRSRGYSS